MCEAASGRALGLGRRHTGPQEAKVNAHGHHSTVNDQTQQPDGHEHPSGPSASSSPTPPTTSRRSSAARSRWPRPRSAADAKKAGTGAGMFAAAAFVALLGLIFLFHTVVAVLDIWLPEWAGYLITTGLLFLVAAILALLGTQQHEGKSRASPSAPSRTPRRPIAAIKSGS